LSVFIKNRVRLIVAKYPILYIPLKKLQGKYGIIDKNTEIVIEGYPRCANSFAEAAFRVSQNRNVNIAHHTHAPAQVVAAVRKRIPVILVFRNPDDAVVSRIIREKNISLKQAYKEYIWFYQSIYHIIDRCVLSNFETTTKSFGCIIQKVNDKYGVNFNIFDDFNPEMTQKAHNLVDNLSKNRIGKETNYTSSLLNTGKHISVNHYVKEKERFKRHIISNSPDSERVEAQRLFNILKSLDITL